MFSKIYIDIEWITTKGINRHLLLRTNVSHAICQTNARKHTVRHFSVLLLYVSRHGGAEVISQLSVLEENCAIDKSWALSEICEKLYLGTLQSVWHFTTLQLPVFSKERCECHWVIFFFFWQLKIFFLCVIASHFKAMSLLCSADPQANLTQSRFHCRLIIQ